MGLHFVVHVDLVLVFNKLALAMACTILLVQTFSHVWWHANEVLVRFGLLHLLGNLANVLVR